MARLNECILYRDFEHGEILDKMAELMNAWEQKAPDLKEKEGLFFECANGLVETAGAYGFSGNLWHCYAKSNRFFSQASPILFIDEIHRFSI